MLESKLIRLLSVICILLTAQVNAAATPESPQGPALNLSIRYYEKALTAEGVLRESHFEETMLRRPGHVWAMRVLPKSSMSEKEGHEHSSHEVDHEHKHFNPVLLPRHVSLENGELKLAYIDRSDKEVINIVATEYENVNFDGSWANAYFLVDPRLVVKLPVSSRVSNVTGAHWYEQEKNGVFQRILWDERDMIPLEVETGRTDGTILRRVSVKKLKLTSEEAPWTKVKGYTQKEYSDFLD